MSRVTRTLLTLALAALLVTPLVGCALLDAVGLGGSRGAEATLVPTITPTPPPPTPTPTIAAPIIDDLADLPTEPGEAFAFRIAEDELNEELADTVYERQGLTVSEPRITLADGKLLGRFRVSHEQTGLGFGITARAVPHVVDGDLYLRIEDITLDEGLGGFTRRIVEGLLDEAVERLATDDGIPVDLDRLQGIAVEDVRVEPGYLIVLGRTA